MVVAVWTEKKNNAANAPIRPRTLVWGSSACPVQDTRSFSLIGTSLESLPLVLPEIS
jgi:hypothetical protein